MKNNHSVETRLENADYSLEARLFAAGSTFNQDPHASGNAVADAISATRKEWQRLPLRKQRALKAIGAAASIALLINAGFSESVVSETTVSESPTIWDASVSAEKDLESVEGVSVDPRQIESAIIEDGSVTVGDTIRFEERNGLIPDLLESARLSVDSVQISSNTD